LLIWLATVNTMSTEELGTAGVLAILCALAARAGRIAARSHWRPPVGALRWLAALPWSVLRETVAALAIAARCRPVGRFTDLELTGERPEAGREALATLIVSATPGSVVVGANDEHGTLLIHSLPVGRTRLPDEVRR
jgi:multisubunit Na+/H+ antiporter MnhE subunit